MVDPKIGTKKGVPHTFGESFASNFKQEKHPTWGKQQSRATDNAAVNYVDRGKKTLEEATYF